MVNKSTRHHLILDLHLVENGFHVLEQIRRGTCDLDPGTSVRIHTGRTRPPIWGIITNNPLDESWYRTDLTWGWIIGEPRHYKRWQQYIDNVQGGN
jgi:hypothetical protein